MNTILAAACLLTTTVLVAQGPMPDLGTTKTPEQRLQGRVLRGEKPVPNAVVRVAWRRIAVQGGASQIAREVVQRETRSDTDGRYSVVVPAWRKIGVWASAGDEVSAVVDSLETPLTKSVDLALATVAPLQGKFVHAGKAPASPVRFAVDRIAATKDALPMRVFGTSAADGSFRISNIPSGRWQLRVSTDDRALRPKALEILESGAAYEVELVRGDAAAITFVARDGSPAKDVAVEVIDHGAIQMATSDADGRVLLRGLEKGHGTNLIATPPVGARRYYSLEPGRDAVADGVPQIRLAIAESFVIRGKLYDINGKPAVGKEVVFRGHIHGAGYPPEDFSQIVKTDASGAYVCEGLDKNLFFQVEALIDDEAQPLGFVDPRPQFFRDQLDPFRIGSRRFVVETKIPDGGPYAYSVRVYGPKELGDLSTFKSLVRGKNGKWVSPSLSAGEYAVLATSETLGFARTQASIRATITGRASTDIKLTMGMPRKVFGTVVGPDRKPMAGINVALVFEGSDSDNQPKRFSDTVVSSILEKDFPADKFPRTVTTKADGKFEFVCHESNGLYDLIATRSNTDGQAGPPPTRLTRVLALKSPIELMIR